MDDNYIYPVFDTSMFDHYGRKGMKWYQHIFGEEQKKWRTLQKVEDYKASHPGATYTEMAAAFGISTGELRQRVMAEGHHKREFRLYIAKQMEEEGISKSDMDTVFNAPKGTAARVLAAGQSKKDAKMNEIRDKIVNRVDEVKYLDIGKGTDIQLGVTRETLEGIVRGLEAEGYHTHTVYLKNLTDANKDTTMRVLSKEPDLKKVVAHKHDIRSLDAWYDPEGKLRDIEPPQQLDWDRVKIRYGDEGGKARDGMMQIRPGAEGLDLGDARYAQVRIAVGGTSYLKGVAIVDHTAKFPPGTDIIFNTNKPKGTPREDVLKPLKKEVMSDNPFGAVIKSQKGYINFVSKEGDWNDWSAGLAAQMVSKQPDKFVKAQLDKTYGNIKKDFEAFQAIEHPVIRSHFLEEYARSLTTKANKLKAEGVEGERAQLLLSNPNLKPNEVYAPNYKNGERVCLIRYPHGGTFEIPELVVNNNHQSSRRILGNAIDAIMVNPSVAGKLSGADFDGDTVYVLPQNKKNPILSTELPPSIRKKVAEFDPEKYHVDMPSGKHVVTKKYSTDQMGIATNLISDMTTLKAPVGDIIDATLYSMVVIDSYKHNYDLKQAKKDFRINDLKKKYQGAANAGSATIITRARSKVKVYEHFDGTLERVKEKSYKTTGANGKEYREKYYVLEDGTEVSKKRVKEVRLMDITKDAHTLKSSHPNTIEDRYANYANGLKALQNEAYKANAAIKMPKKDPQAAKQYAPEVQSIEGKLKAAMSKAPTERQIELLAEQRFRHYSYPGMEAEDRKKLAARSRITARKIVTGQSQGPKSRRSERMHLTDMEWQAIFHNALSPSTVKRVLEYCDSDEVREKVIPKGYQSIPSAKISRARAMLAQTSGGKPKYTYAEVAEALGVSVSALRDNLG